MVVAVNFHRKELRPGDMRTLEFQVKSKFPVTRPMAKDVDDETSVRLELDIYLMVVGYENVYCSRPNCLCTIGSLRISYTAQLFFVKELLKQHAINREKMSPTSWNRKQSKGEATFAFGGLAR